MTFRIDDAAGRPATSSASPGPTGSATRSSPTAPCTISGKKDETKLRILADRQRYKVGEEASVNLHSRGRAGTALLTWEADRILTYRLVTLKDGDNPVGWAIDGPQFPNFTLTAARMWENQFDQAKLDIRVERDLQGDGRARSSRSVGPGRDRSSWRSRRSISSAGRSSAELSLAMVDQSLLRLYGDRHAADRRRSSTTRPAPARSRPRRPTRSTTHPRPMPVAQAVVEEAERAAAVAANAADRAGIQEQAQRPGRSAMDAARRRCTAPRPRRAPAPAASRRQRRMMARHGRRGRRNDGHGRTLEARLAEGRPESRPAGIGGQAARMVSSADAEEAEEAADRRRASKPCGEVELWRCLAGRTATRRQGRRGAARIPRAVRRDGLLEPAASSPTRTARPGSRFKAPSALSEYRITARGVTGADTLVGQTTAVADASARTSSSTSRSPPR